MQSHDDNTRMYCKRCAYDLQGVTGAQCPECGTQFDANNPLTFDKSPRSRRFRVLWRIATIISVVGILLYIFVPRGWDSISLVLNDGMTTTGATALGFRRPSWWGGYHVIWVSDVYDVVPGNGLSKPSIGTQSAQVVFKSGKNSEAFSFDTKGRVDMLTINSTSPVIASGKVPRISINLNAPAKRPAVVVEFDRPRKAVRKLMNEQDESGVQFSTATYFMEPITR